MVTTKVDIKYGKFPNEVTVPVVVVKMQDDLKAQYPFKTACPDCATDESYSALGRLTICKNTDCDNHKGFKGTELKTLDYKTAWTKQQVEDCKSDQTKALQVLGTKPKDFSRHRIMGCYYVVPNLKEDGAEDRMSYLVGGLKASKSALVVSSNRTGSEKMGMLAIEDGNLVLFDIALDEQLRPLKEQFTLDTSKETEKLGKDWIDSIPEFDFSTMESQTNKNYGALISGEEIAVEVKVEKVKKTAKDMFASKGKVETDKVAESLRTPDPPKAKAKKPKKSK
jgi:hypothetical protein